MKHPRSIEWKLIIGFILLKLLIHYLTYQNFELHRDAYLYYAQSENLAWGFVSVPPSIAFFGKIATIIFGNTTFALRFFPAIIGALNILVIGAFILELGGKYKAIILGCLAFLLSPAYLHTNTLFQPVAFNQFYWLLSGYLIFRMIRRNDPKMWIWIGITFGLAFLNKYSIVFFYLAFAIAILFTRHRSLILSRYFLISIAVGLVIIAPNLHWQYSHNWPVMMHMSELRATQLVHVKLGDFIIPQFLMNMHALLLWIFALAMLLFHKSEKQFRLFGYIYLLMIGILLLTQGKAYYTLGYYPIFFAFGGFYFDKYVTKFIQPLFYLLIIVMLTGLYISQSFDGIPLSTPDQVRSKGAFRWEDGVYHDIPQDMSDMTGWKEIGEAVREIYMGLSEDEKADCAIYCYHYGQGGSIMFYGKHVGIPQPISTNGSFVFWSPDELDKNKMIYVHSDLGNDIDPDERLSQFFEMYTLKKTIDNKDFRENGTRIYLCESPKEEALEFYANMMKDLKDQYQKLD